MTPQQDAHNFPTTWPLPVNVKSNSHSLKSDSSLSNVTHNPEYWRSLAGSPFEPESDSSSDDEDDAMSLGSSDLSSTIGETPFSKDLSLISEGIGTLNIMESNVLGLVFMSEEDVFATEAVATFAQQPEGLRAPTNHQDDRSCGHPNQKHRAQLGHVAFQSDGPADNTLVGRFPQDIGLWSDMSDPSVPKVSEHDREAIPADQKDVSGVPRRVGVSFRGSLLVW